MGYTFKDAALLCLALTHSSYANENPDKISGNNERLEYLGDAVLELCMSEMLYTQFPEAAEGKLTRMRSKLVSEPALADKARELKVGEVLFLGKGEAMQGGRERDSLLADVQEALLGAVFLDGGYSAAKDVVKKIFMPQVAVLKDIKKPRDSKSRLQEFTQEKFKVLPVYTLVDSTGPDHAKVFTVEVTLPDGTLLVATGSSLKRAEQDAAASALEYFSVG